MAARFRIWLSIAIIALVVPVADAAEVKIGVLGPMTGGSAMWGSAQMEGIQLAADELNARGGIKGLGKIVLVSEDDQCQPSVGVNAA